MYSLGVCLNEMLTGKRPFANTYATVISVRVGVFGARPDLPDHTEQLPVGLIPLIQACWSDMPGVSFVCIISS